MISARDNRLHKVQQLCDQAAVHLQQQRYHRAIADYLLALEIVEEWGTPQMTASLLYCLGSIYRQLEIYPRALSFYQRTMALLPESDHELRPMTLQHIHQLTQQQKENRSHNRLLITARFGGELLAVCC
jgi:tetratricopeptide (TPR) repeat protein